MSAPKATDRKVAELDALRADPSSESTLAALRAALRDRSGSVAARAAKLGAEFGRRELLPDLTQAFDRFLIDPAKSDPQCWAKNAIAAALRTLRTDDPGPWLRGVAHVQMEAVWGGKADTAAALRSACALALLDCDLVSTTQLLPILADLLADPEKPVRVDATRALAATGRSEAAILLRYKGRIGDAEPEVVGEVFAALFGILPAEALDLVAPHLSSDNPDLRIEAAAALGASKNPKVVDLLIGRWPAERDANVKEALVLSLEATRDPRALEFAADRRVHLRRR